MADLIAFTDLASYLNVTFTASEQATATLCCTATSDAVRTATSRSFEIQGAAADRFFTAKRPYVYPGNNYYGTIDWSVVYPSLFSAVLPNPMLEVDDFFLTNQTLGNITVTDTISLATYTPTQTWPFNAASIGDPYTRLVFAPGTYLPLGVGQLKVNAKWGYVTAIPQGLKTLALLQAARYFRRKDAPFGIVGDLAIGSGMRLAPGLDRDVEQMLSSYRRWWAAA